MLVNHKKKISFKVYYVVGFARRGNPVAEVELIGLIAILLAEKGGVTDGGRGGVREFHLAFFFLGTKVCFPRRPLNLIN